MKYRVLLVDDSPISLKETRAFLERHSYPVDTTESGDEAINIVRRQRGEYALAIIDYNMRGRDGADTTKALRDIHPDLNAIILSEEKDREAIRNSLYQGARRFVDKGDEATLLKEVNDWYRQYEDAHRIVASSTELQENERRIRSIGMIGCSAGLAKVVDLVEKFVSTYYPIRIEGETGAGKERVARALYRGGDPKKFIPVNCARFKGSVEMMQSELFGYVRGAFTGANTDKTGMFEEADDGIIFLDEIHTLGLAAQEQLLRVLEEKKVSPVGSTREYSINCRVIASCKPDLKQRVNRGEFLPDLFERLNVLVIRIPPLKERKEDIPLLAVHFLNEWELEHKQRKSFLLGAMRELESYDWPRNVRELQHMVKRLATLVDGEKITKKDVKEQLRSIEPEGGFRQQLDDLTREKLISTLTISKQRGLSLRRTAEFAGVPYTSFRNMLDRYGFRFSDVQKAK